MRADLALSVAVVALTITSSAPAQSAGQPAPGAVPVPVYKGWMPPASPFGSEAPSKPAVVPATSGSSSGSSSQSTTAAKDTTSSPTKPADSGSTTVTRVGVVDAPSGGPAAAEKADEPSRRYEDGDGPWHASVDAVFGFGVTRVVNQDFVGPLLNDEKRSLTNTRFATQSIDLALSYEVSRGLRIGAMLPVGGGTIYSSQTRQDGIIGNLTIGGEYKFRLGEGVDGYAGVGVALPTATGEELPTADDIARGTHVNQTDRDRFSLQHAMSDSRGREDIAAFAPNHLGLVPKLGLIWRASNRVEIEPYANYASLHSVQSGSSYEGAIVAGARFTYRFGEQVDATVRGWANVPVAGVDSVVAVAEPQLRGHFGRFIPLVGAILPVAGELRDPYVIGARVAVAARF